MDCLDLGTRHYRLLYALQRVWLRRLPIENFPDRPNTFVVVLTGGIASGKTTVSEMFAELGVPIVDTDVIARRLVAPGSSPLQQIVTEFGSEILDKSGHLDRARLRKIIFQDSTARSLLESILHPLIAKEALSQLYTKAAPYCLLVVPLYAESARWSFVDRVCVVDVCEEAQVKRLMMRDGINRAQAVAALNAQAKREHRLSVADDVIDNSGDHDSLRQQVETYHERYLKLAECAGF